MYKLDAINLCVCIGCCLAIFEYYLIKVIAILWFVIRFVVCFVMLVFALIGSYWVCYFILVATLDTTKDEITSAGFYRRRSGMYIIDQDQGQTRTSTKASHPNACCYYTYHYQSCMFLPLKFYQNLVIKN